MKMYKNVYIILMKYYYYKYFVENLHIMFVFLITNTFCNDFILSNFPWTPF